MTGDSIVLGGNNEEAKRLMAPIYGEEPKMNEAKISYESERLILELRYAQRDGLGGARAAEALRAHIASLESQLAEAQAAMAWRPISAAPKGERVIMLNFGSDYPWVARVGPWMAQGDLWRPLQLPTLAPIQVMSAPAESDSAAKDEEIK